MKFSNPTISKQAFTLAELLVVIAVMAILAALLLPALASAKAKAKKTTCISNLKQLNLGIRMYADDHADVLPNAGSNSYLTYKELMKSYVGLKGTSSAQDLVFACPADSYYFNDATAAYVAQGLHTQSYHDYSSYAFNGLNLLTNYLNMDENGALPGVGGLKLNSIKNPARTVLVAEWCGFFPYSWHGQKPADGPVINNARAMLSFADGHADYTRMYWNSNIIFFNSSISLAGYYDPPAGYDYQWSGN